MSDNSINLPKPNSDLDIIKVALVLGIEQERLLAYVFAKDEEPSNEPPRL